jgi:hypothetical protein
MFRFPVRSALATMVALAALTGRVAAQDLAVPITVQVTLVARILGFDRNLARQKSELVVGILFQGRYRPGAEVAEAARAAIGGLSPAEAGGTVLRPVLIDLDDTPDLAAALARERITVVYVSPLRALDPAKIAIVTRGGQIRSFTGVPRYVESSLAVAIELKGDRPEIVINLNAARAEGADFGAQLLKLARVIGMAERP